MKTLDYCTFIEFFFECFYIKYKPGCHIQSNVTLDS